MILDCESDTVTIALTPLLVKEFVGQHKLLNCEGAIHCFKRLFDVVFRIGFGDIQGH